MPLPPKPPYIYRGGIAYPLLLLLPLKILRYFDLGSEIV